MSGNVFFKSPDWAGPAEARPRPSSAPPSPSSPTGTLPGVRRRHGLWSQGSHGLSSASRSPPPSPAASAPPPHRPSSPSHQPRRRAAAGSGRLHLRSRQPSVAGSLEHDGRRWMPWLCATDAVLTRKLGLEPPALLLPAGGESSRPALSPPHYHRYLHPFLFPPLLSSPLSLLHLCSLPPLTPLSVHVVGT